MQEYRKDREGSFARLGLTQEVLCAVADLGYGEPTTVQERVIPHVLKGHDVLVAAQTGTGKTASFLLPALCRVGLSTRAKAPTVLVVVPTRELAMQVAGVAAVVGKHTGHTATAVVGGVGYAAQRRALQSGCDVLVSTPGRLLDLVEQGHCDLADVELLVLDEADRMLNMGFLPSVQKIAACAANKEQTLLFSATLDDKAIGDISHLVHDPVRIETAALGSVAELVTQYVLYVDAQDKKRTLVNVLRNEHAKRVLVFVRGKRRADHLCRILQHKGFSCVAIHGDRSQRQRSYALKRFAKGEVDVLVATDVLARGIDIEDVPYVINADVPHEAESYVHRVGRTGRAGRKGWALTLCSAQERRDFLAIEKCIGMRVPVFTRAKASDCGEPTLESADNGSVGDHELSK